MLEDIGEFDAEMFAIHEDTDLGWRANLYGYQVMYNPNAIAKHRMHGTLDHQDPHSAHLLWRNRLRSSIVNLEFPNLIRYLVPQLAATFSYVLLSTERRQIMKALCWNVSKLRSTLQRRSRVQKGRRVTDDAAFKLFESGLRGPGRGRTGGG